MYTIGPYQINKDGLEVAKWSLNDTIIVVVMIRYSHCVKPFVGSILILQL